MIAALQPRLITSLAAETAALLPAWDRALWEDYQRSPATRSAYAGDIRHAATWFSEHYPGLRWADLTADHLVAYRESMLAQGWAPGTCNRRRAALLAWYDWLMLTHRVSDMVPDRVALAPCPVLRLTVLTPEQLHMLLSALGADTWLDRRDRAIIHLVLATGISTGELVALRRDDIQADRLTVRAQGDRSRVERWLPLPSAAAEALVAYLHTPRPRRCRVSGDCLFVGDKGGALYRQAVWHILRRAARRAGLPAELTVSQLRATAARGWLAAGESWPDVAARLGVALTTTAMQRYGEAAD